MEYIAGDGFIYTESENKYHSFDDRPAVIYNNGSSRYWYRNGKLHRDGDMPAIIISDDTQYWYKNGLLHRHGKPAIVESDGHAVWYQDGIKIKECNDYFPIGRKSARSIAVKK